MKPFFNFIFKNRLVRITGISLILYYSLFANTDKPESLGNRLNKENLKKGFIEAQEKTKFIASNLNLAKEINDKRKEGEKRNIALFFDEKVGTGEELIECEDEVKFSAKIYSKNSKLIRNSIAENIVVGSNSFPLLEKGIIGMKKDGIRNIEISRNSSVQNSEIVSILSEYDTDIIYQVKTQSITKSQNNDNKNCNW